MTYPKEHKLKMQAGGAHGGGEKANGRPALRPTGVVCRGGGQVAMGWHMGWHMGQVQAVGSLWLPYPYPATLLLKGGGAASVAAVIHAHTMN